MTEQPLLDAGNLLLDKVPGRLDLGITDSPEGKLGILTVRTSSATVTVFLAPDEVRSWAALLGSLADQLGAGTLTPATVMDMSLLGQLRRPGQ